MLRTLNTTSTRVRRGGSARFCGIAYADLMAGEHRRVAAQSAAHAQGLADNLSQQGFVVESQATHEWVLRKKRRRGDHVVTIAITQPAMVQPAAPPPEQSPGNCAPPHA
jgi:hypothetical protein